MRSEGGSPAGGRRDGEKRTLEESRAAARRTAALYLSGRPRELAEMARSLTFLAEVLVDDQPALAGPLKASADLIKRAAAILRPLTEPEPSERPR